MMNEMKKMKTLTLQGIPFEVVDEAARNDIESVKDTLENLPDNTLSVDDGVPSIVNRVTGDSIELATKSDISGTVSWNDLADKPFGEVGRSRINLMPETTLDINNGLFVAIPEFDIIKGDTYIITCDGIEHECIAWEDVADNLLPMIGNGKAYGDWVPDEFASDVPFCIEPGYINFLTEGTYTVSIDKLAIEYKLISENYIPPVIGKPGTGKYGEVFNYTEFNIASGEASHAEGIFNNAIGDYSHAEGSSNNAIGNASHAEGRENKAIGRQSHAEGWNNTVIGVQSHVEGANNRAYGGSSHAEGAANVTFGVYSHAEGVNAHAYSLRNINVEANATEFIYNNNLTADQIKSLKGLIAIYETENSYSFARVLGVENIAYSQYKFILDKKLSSQALNGVDINFVDGVAGGEASHKEGNGTIAYGQHSHAEGLSTSAIGDNQHVQGKYNIEDEEGKYAHIVGNGTEMNARSNAHTLDWEGNAWYAGNVEATAIILRSFTEGSTKRFKITVDDNGTITATEIT